MAPEASDPRPARAPAGELLSAVSALALFVVMFVMKWYGVVALPHSADRSGIQSATSAWNELADIRWLMLLTVLVAFGSVVIHISQRSHGSQTDTSRVVTAVAGVTAALVFYRVLIDLPSPTSVVDAKLGAYLGLLAVVGVALGGYESMRAQRVAQHAIRHRERRRVTGAADPPPRPLIAPEESGSGPKIA
ncbi:MAG TPA: hypothetical protein VG223_02675 [Solirubrobacteraceae bacterium]|jgi:hypothetical protein|nr:hypothetical protein [Solirubrobacteraceae bacterium]